MVDNNLFWQCETCTWKVEGTAQGSVAALNHQKWAKKNQENHPIVLVNAETGQIMEDDDGQPIRSLSKAQRLGFIPGTSGRKPKIITAPGKASPSPQLKAKIKPLEVDLDARVHFLYEWDRAVFPEYNNTFGEWIWECIMGFHIQNMKRFKLDRIFIGGE